MNLVVGFTCLVCVVVIGCVTGIPDPQNGAFGRSRNGQFGIYKSASGPRFLSPGYAGGGFGGPGFAAGGFGGPGFSRRQSANTGFGGGGFGVRKSGGGTIAARQGVSAGACMLNNINYVTGTENDDTCMVMECDSNSAWKSTQTIRKECGTCNMEGDPHFLTFDETNFLTPNNRYKFGEVGTFVITQNGLSSPFFGVNATFATCNTNMSLTCITSIRYYEPGIIVDVELPDQDSTSGFTTFPRCTAPGVVPSMNEQLCKFTVKVNGTDQPVTSVISVQAATFGDVLIFKQNSIRDVDNLSCMNVVGSQGLSVSLCQHREDFSWLYIFPMQTLKIGNRIRRHGQRPLYGLCNTYTGFTQSAFTVRSGAATRNTAIFGQSWKST